MSESDSTTAPVASLFGAPKRGASAASSLVTKLARRGEETLLAQLEQLKAERAAGGAIVLLDPERVSYGDLPNRDESRLSPEDPELQKLIALIDEFEQQSPIQVLPLSGNPHFDHVVVSGRRRVASCRFLKKKYGSYPVRAILDAKAALDPQLEAMHAWMENDARAEMSAFETGRMFAGWIEANIFPSQDVIADRTKLGKSAVSQYIALYRLPAVVRAAFPDFLKVPMRWGQNLVKCAREDGPGLEARAQDIASRKPRPDEETTYHLLVLDHPVSPIASSASKRTQASSPSNSLTQKRQNRTVFEFQESRRGYTIKLGRVVKKGTTEEQRHELQERLKNAVDDWVRSLKIPGLEDEK